jgi:hypothetical protein
LALAEVFLRKNWITARFNHELFGASCEMPRFHTQSTLIFDKVGITAVIGVGGVSTSSRPIWFSDGVQLSRWVGFYEPMAGEVEKWSNDSIETAWMCTTVGLHILPHVESLLTRTGWLS